MFLDLDSTSFLSFLCRRQHFPTESALTVSRKPVDGLLFQIGGVHSIAASLVLLHRESILTVTFKWRYSKRKVAGLTISADVDSNQYDLFLVTGSIVNYEIVSIVSFFSEQVFLQSTWYIPPKKRIISSDSLHSVSTSNRCQLSMILPSLLFD